MKFIDYSYGIITIKFSINHCLWFLALLIMFVLFFIGGPNYYSSAVFKEFWNIGHILFFALSSYKLITLIKHKSVVFIVFVSFAYCLVLGGAIELIQSKINRSFSLHDLYRDALGTALALSFFYFQENKLLKQPNKPLFHLSIALLLTSLSLIIFDQNRLYQSIKLNFVAQQNFPVLSDFDNKNELQQWKGNNLTISSEQVLTGLYSMKVELSSKTKYSGFTLKEFPGDWRSYDYLLINIFNSANENLKICTKISDLKHDLYNQAYSNRFNKCFTLLSNQWNNIKIPLTDIENSPKSRKMDMSNMSQLGLFSSGLKDNKTIFLDYITLL